MTGAGNDALATGALTDAVIEAARDGANGEWGQPPRLYALMTRAALDSAVEALPETVRAASGDALIPIEQDPPARGRPGGSPGEHPVAR